MEREEGALRLPGAWARIVRVLRKSSSNLSAFSHASLKLRSLSVRKAKGRAGWQQGLGTTEGLFHTSMPTG